MDKFLDKKGLATYTNKMKGYIDSKVPSAASSIADGETGYTTGDQVKTYVDSNGFNPSNMETVSETVTINHASIPTAAAISNGETGFTTGDQVYDYIQERVPDAPTTDGTYVLKVTVSNGTPTYSWVSA